MFRNIIILFGIFFVSLCFAIEEIAPNWSLPTDPAFKGRWRAKSPTRFLSCVADFDGDGDKDTAKIMESTNGNGIGLFVFLVDTGESVSPICLYNSETDSANLAKLNEAQKARIQEIYKSSFGVKVVKKGHYKTACGKGYFDCLKDEPAEITLQFPGIDFFQYDAGGERYFFWVAEKKKFIVQQMSD